MDMFRIAEAFAQELLQTFGYPEYYPLQEIINSAHPCDLTEATKFQLYLHACWMCS